VPHNQNFSLLDLKNESYGLMAQASIEQEPTTEDFSKQQKQQDKGEKLDVPVEISVPRASLNIEDSSQIKSATVTPQGAESITPKSHWETEVKGLQGSQNIDKSDQFESSVEQSLDGHYQTYTDQQEQSTVIENNSSGDYGVDGDPSEKISPSQNQSTYECRETVSCPQSLVGRLIGKQGETIKELQRRCGARIQIDQNFPDGEARVVMIQGETQAVEIGVRLVTNLIGSSPAIGNGAPGELTTFECPKSLVGRVIGKGGETINELQRRSGARIQIEQRVPEGAPCIIEVQGHDNAVAEAIRLTNEVMAGKRLDIGISRETFGGNMIGGMLFSHPSAQQLSEIGGIASPMASSHTSSSPQHRGGHQFANSPTTGIYPHVQRSSSQDQRNSGQRNSTGSQQDRRRSSGSTHPYAHQQHFFMSPQYTAYYQQAGYAYPGYPVQYASMPYGTYNTYPTVSWHAGPQHQHLQSQQRQHAGHQSPTLQPMATSSGTNHNIATPPTSGGSISSGGNQAYQTTGIGGNSQSSGLNIGQQQQSVQHSSQPAGMTAYSKQHSASTGHQSTSAGAKPRQDSWSSHSDNQGRVYWYNHLTGESTWQAPSSV